MGTSIFPLNGKGGPSIACVALDACLDNAIDLPPSFNKVFGHLLPINIGVLTSVKSCVSAERRLAREGYEGEAVNNTAKYGQS